MATAPRRVNYAIDDPHYDCAVFPGEGDSVPTVLLRHELANGTSHIDWMIATDPDGRGPLTTFRLTDRVDQLHAGASLHAERLSDHRSAYLEYEGPISGGRGRVQRVAWGRANVVGDDSKVNVKVSWSPGERSCIMQMLRLVPQSANEWNLQCRLRVIEDRPQ